MTLLLLTTLLAGPLPAPAVYVLDPAGQAAAVFGAPGTRGRPGRCDSPDVPRGTPIGETSDNPLQAAIDYAAEHKLREVRLDLGEYTFAKTQASHTGRVGFYVPSNLHLKGVLVGDEPGSVLTPGEAVGAGGGTPPPQRFELLVLPSGSRTDKRVPLVDTTIEAVTLNARLLGGVCLWAGGGRGLKLLEVHSLGSRQSSLIIGGWDDARADPERPGGAAIYYQREFEVARCHVHGANGDGICTIGQDGYVHDNLLENGTTTFDNGLTPFIGSRRIRFLRNTIIGFPTAIGLDGSSMPLRRRPGMADAAAEKLSREQLQAALGGWDGYNRDHEIAFNVIRGCRRGIVLHRADGIRIHDNTLVGRQVREAISLEESSHCAVWRNAAHGWQIGLQLYAHAFSALAEDGKLIGTSYNQLGLDPDGHELGNDLTGNTIGIAWRQAVPQTRLSHNRLVANDTAGCVVAVDGVPTD